MRLAAQRLGAGLVALGAAAVIGALPAAFSVGTPRLVSHHSGSSATLHNGHIQQGVFLVADARAGSRHVPTFAAAALLGSLTILGAFASIFCRAVLAERRRAGQHSAPTVARAFEEEIGVQPPLGYWDPLGLAADGDVADFRRRRESELKHGRVAMYAAMGYIAPVFYRWPGYVSPSSDITFEDVPHGLAALDVVPVEGWLQIIAWCGWFELVVYQPQNPAEPGNYYKGRWGVFANRFIADKELRRNKLNVEMANGRLAMMAILGMMFQNGFFGTTGPRMWLPQPPSF